MQTEQHKVGALRRLAEQFPPAWRIPPDLQWFGLPEHELEALFNISISPDACAVLRVERRMAEDRLESIEDGTAYMRPCPGLDGWATWGPETAQEARNPKTSRFSLDRCAAYHHLWWIDVLINVHEAPAP